MRARDLCFSLGLFLLSIPSGMVSAMSTSKMPIRENPSDIFQKNVKKQLVKSCNGGGFQSILAEEARVSSLNNSAASSHANALWLNRQLIKWPFAATRKETARNDVRSDGAQFRLYASSKAQVIATPQSKVAGADATLVLDVFQGELSSDIQTRFKYVSAGIVLRVADADVIRLPALLKQQLILVKEDASGNVIDATRLQLAGALDDIYADAEKEALGVSVLAKETQFRLWAPTAQAVSVCIYDAGLGGVSELVDLAVDTHTGIWTYDVPRDLSGKYYTYLVDVFVPGAGLVRNRVTDPYSVSLTTDSKRSYIANLDNARLKPRDWDVHKNPVSEKVKAFTDMLIYELHVRDFSINDTSVSGAHRGKYLAFTESNSYGMRHLKALSKAGMTDVHLLPVFDFATVPERGCLSSKIAPSIDRKNLVPDSETPQAIVSKVKQRDCFNWGYDPLHYTAPEGSYATDAADGARRIVEFRQMVAALHGIGLRVGMDVVYNHTSASGQHEKSVLDRIVPGYYHRLNANGEVEKSTCCDNTATENKMMAKLMIDSVVTWAREYKIDSFRFDLMGHQPRAAMEALQRRLKAETGRNIQLIGEGWNFGEVADGAHFVQASQLSLNGSGVGTFSDRARDAVRGGGAADSGEVMVKRKGFINGAASLCDQIEAARIADMVRVGLAGSIRDYPLKTYQDKIIPLSRIDYAGQPAGYVSQPNEVVNYVENHDNQTLFDINVYKLPINTSREDRARVQVLALAINMFSQGIAYFHAGGELLRSKSLDRNSFDSGDWFNRIDWRARDNYFGIGSPMKADNGNDYHLIKPLLANASIKPTATEIAWTRDAFFDLLNIRASTSLFRLRSAEDIASRLTFYNTGSTQNPALLVGHLNGVGYEGATFRELIYFVNVDSAAQIIRIDALAGRAFHLHPVHLANTAADKRIQREARVDLRKGEFHVPARSAVVFVVD